MIYKALLTACLAIGIAGCETPVQLQSVKSPNFERMPKRMLFVASFIFPLDGARGLDAAAAVKGALSVCGVEADVEVVVPPVSGDSIGRKVREFSPDTITIIQWKSKRAFGNAVDEVNYDLEMTDIQSKAVVWKAAMVVSGHPLGTDVPQNFTIQLISQLKKDGIVTADCPLPKGKYNYF